MVFNSAFKGLMQLFWGSYEKRNRAVLYNRERLWLLRMWYVFSLILSERIDINARPRQVLWFILLSPHPCANWIRAGLESSCKVTNKLGYPYGRRFGSKIAWANRKGGWRGRGGSGYFRATPSPVWIPQHFSNVVILHLPAYEDEKDTVFRNVGIYNSDTGELTRRKLTT
jgi:hypothetical protein